jgi:hypothetical protein
MAVCVCIYIYIYIYIYMCVYVYQLQKRYEILHFSPECIYILRITDTQTKNYFLTGC